MRISSPVSKRKARIEIVPLIDVVFFLLATFVMVSLSMVKNQGIDVHLPAASTGAAQDRKSAVTITVTEAGDVYLNKEKIGSEALSTRLTGLKTADPDVKVFINGDEKASFGSAIGVLDLVRKMGITKVAIQTQANRSPENHKDQPGTVPQEERRG